MNFEDRTNAIGTLLREHILPRYKRPEHLDDETARAELRDMVADLNAAWPLMGPDRFGDVCDGLCRSIRKTHTSRSWPTIAAMLKALSLAMEPPRAVVGGDDAEKQEALYGMVRDWWRQFGSPFPSVAKDHHCERLVSEGHATWGQLHRAGFPMQERHKGLWFDEPDPAHPAMLEALEALTAERRARIDAGVSVGAGRA